MGSPLVVVMDGMLGPDGGGVNPLLESSRACFIVSLFIDNRSGFIIYLSCAPQRGRNAILAPTPVFRDLRGQSRVSNTQQCLPTQHFTSYKYCESEGSSEATWGS